MVDTVRAWELKTLAAKGEITAEQRDEWERLQRDCVVNHNSPKPDEKEGDNCGVCAAYLG